MAEALEKKPLANNFQTWIAQGESLYNAALNDFRMLENQLDELEQRLAAKQAEVNQIAQIIGKPMVEGARRLSAQMTPPPELLDEPSTLPAKQVGSTVTSSNNATIARALTGKFGR